MFDNLFGRLKGKRPDRPETTERDFTAQFNQVIAGDLRPYQIPGLSPEGSQVALEQPFSDLRLVETAAAGKGQQAAAKEIGGNRPIWDFLRSVRLAEERAFAILGAPGTGKTTLLKHLGFTFATSRHERFGMRAHTPFLLHLPEHRRILAADNSAPTLDALLHGIYSDEARFPGLAPPKDFFTKLLEQGPALILLDGFDEFAELPERQAAARWTSKQIERFAGARFVLAARPGAYREVHLERPRVLELQPLRSENVRRFLENIYLVTEITDASKKDDQALRQAALKRAGDAVQWIHDVPPLLPLSTTPLLLTALAQVYKRHGPTLQQAGNHPRGRAMTYAKVCEVLLEGRGSGPLQPGHKLGILGVLAENMMRRKLRDIKPAEMLKVIQPALPAGQTPEAALPALTTEGAVLLENEPGRFRFAHHALQEYLAVAYMVQKPGERRFDALAGDNFWYDALVLYSALGDATPVLSACLKANTTAALGLCGECLEGARQVDPAVQEAADKAVRQDIESDNPKLRRAAVEARLYRRLRTLQRIDDLREIDPDFLTCGEYQIFLDEMRERGHNYQPDHWTEPRFPKGQALQPVAGVRAEDARDFCVWLSMRQGGNVRFRLPRPDEARLFPAPSGALSTTCCDGQTYNLMGLNQKIEQGIMAKLGKLPLMKIPSTLPLEKSLNANLEQSFNRALFRALDFELDPVVERSLTHALNHVRDLVMSRAFELGSVISPDLDLARILARANQLQKHVSTAFDRYDLKEAERLLDELLVDAVEGDPTVRFANLLKALIPAIKAEKTDEVQRAQRRYLAVMAEYVYEAIENDDSLATSQKRQQQQPVMEFYAWLQIMLARSAGQLPAWEGIRMVREQVTAGSQMQVLDLPSWAYNA